MKNTQAIQGILDNSIDGKVVFGTTFALKFDNKIWNGASGNMSADSPFFIASTTKLFTTALVLKLISRGVWRLEDPIGKFLGSEVMKDLHVFKGIDYSAHITIGQLMAHTSGLPDYFQGKGPDGTSLEKRLTSGIDQGWTFEEAIALSKSMQPHFAPGTLHKAKYADTNFQLLGRMIENCTGVAFAAYCHSEIISPLGLSQTYLYADPTDSQPQPLYFRDQVLRIPKAMASFGPDGGMVSSSCDLLRFLEGFFLGELFPQSYLPSLQKWNKIFFPMKAGIGIQLFELPWILNPFGTVPAFIGHSGLSGALAYYSPSQRIMITGTVNQISNPDRSFRVMIRLAQLIKTS